MAQVGRGSHRPLIGMNSATIRQQNRSAVFEAIRHYAPISRKVLARHTGLNPATVTHIVDDLIAANLVEESSARDVTVPPRRTGGRREIGLAMNADACYLVGVDLTRTRTTVVVTNLAAEIVVDERFEVSLSHSTDMSVERVIEMIDLAMARSGVPRARLRGIGIGAPGPLNTRTGTILASTFKGWMGVPLKALLEQRFGLPVTIDNDANTSALAEQWFGAGKELSNFAFVAVGAGVGRESSSTATCFRPGATSTPSSVTRPCMSTGLAARAAIGLSRGVQRHPPSRPVHDRSDTGWRKQHSQLARAGGATLGRTSRPVLRGFRCTGAGDHLGGGGSG